MSDDEVQTEVVASTNTEKEVDRSKTWQGRMDRFFDKDALKEYPVKSINQQEVYGYLAQANGGIFGVGIGNSRECSRLPLAF